VARKFGSEYVTDLMQVNSSRSGWMKKVKNKHLRLLLIDVMHLTVFTSAFGGERKKFLSHAELQSQLM